MAALREAAVAAVGAALWEVVAVTGAVACSGSSCRSSGSGAPWQQLWEQWECKCQLQEKWQAVVVVGGAGVGSCRSSRGGSSGGQHWVGGVVVGSSSSQRSGRVVEVRGAVAHGSGRWKSSSCRSSAGSIGLEEQWQAAAAVGEAVVAAVGGAEADHGSSWMSSSRWQWRFEEQWHTAAAIAGAAEASGGSCRSSGRWQWQLEMGAAAVAGVAGVAAVEGAVVGSVSRRRSSMGGAVAAISGSCSSNMGGGSTHRSSGLQWQQSEKQWWQQFEEQWHWGWKLEEQGHAVVAVVGAVAVVCCGSSCKSNEGASGSWSSDGGQWQWQEVEVGVVAGAAGGAAVEGAVVGRIGLEEQWWAAAAWVNNGMILQFQRTCIVQWEVVETHSVKVTLGFGIFGL